MMSGTKVSVPIFNLIEDQSADVLMPNVRMSCDVLGCSDCSDARHKVRILNRTTHLI